MCKVRRIPSAVLLHSVFIEHRRENRGSSSNFVLHTHADQFLASSRPKRKSGISNRSSYLARRRLAVLLGRMKTATSVHFSSMTAQESCTYHLWYERLSTYVALPFTAIRHVVKTILIDWKGEPSAGRWARPVNIPLLKTLHEHI